MKPKPHTSLAFPRPCYRAAAISDRILKLLQLVNGFLEQKQKNKDGNICPRRYVRTKKTLSKRNKRKACMK